jgi:hypothetical protein
VAIAVQPLGFHVQEAGPTAQVDESDEHDPVAPEAKHQPHPTTGVHDAHDV